MKKILFIEDQPALQKALTESLSDRGYEVFSALDGEIGLRMASKEQPDIILLDLVLPKKDGFSVLKDLKNAEETKSIPVVILSNLEGSTDVQQALELGATTYLVKANYELNEVIRKIEGILEKE